MPVFYGEACDSACNQVLAVPATRKLIPLVSGIVTKHSGRLTGVLFAIALLDASIIGACAVSLSTAYALGDVFAVRHSLHSKPAQAKGFYAIYFGLTLLAAGLVLTPGVPLGLLTNAVQSLAGILLPSATVFLLLLCNDKAVLGPWVNGRWTNLFTGTVVAGLVTLSIILTASVLFPQIGEREILGTLLGGTVLALAASLFVKRYETRRLPTPLPSTPPSVDDKAGWTMPPLAELPVLKLTLLNRVWMLVLRGYLMVAAGLVLVRIVTLVAAGH
ncbi:divalent metal cation transporter [Cupriavidus sp. CV2]|nr:divalent metal cation transporter [Cupriavidus sp. CV2]